MADEEEPEFETRFHYEHSADGTPSDEAQDGPVDAAQDRTAYGEAAEPAGGSRDVPACGESTEPATCPACRGTGSIVLLVSSRPCEACGGTGKIAPASGSPQASSASSPQGHDDAGGEGIVDFNVDQVKGNWVTSCTFDAQDRLTSETREFVPDEPGAEGGKA